MCEGAVGFSECVRCPLPLVGGIGGLCTGEGFALVSRPEACSHRRLRCAWRMARGPGTAPAAGPAPLCFGVGEAGHPVGAGRRSRKGREAAPGLQGHCKDSWMYPVFPSTTAGSFGPGYRRGLRPRFATCGLLPQTPSLRLAYSQRPRHRAGRRLGTTLGFSYNHPRCAWRIARGPGTASAEGPAPLLALATTTLAALGV